MLNKYDSYQSPPSFATRGHIPAGQYKAKIVDCKWSYGNSYKIVISFMILEEGKEYNKRCNMYLDILAKTKFADQARENLHKLLTSIGSPPIKSDTDINDLPLVSLDSLNNILFKDTEIFVDLISNNGRSFNVASMSPPYNYRSGEDRQVAPVQQAAAKAKPWEDDDVPF